LEEEEEGEEEEEQEKEEEEEEAEASSEMYGVRRRSIWAFAATIQRDDGIS